MVGDTQSVRADPGDEPPAAKVAKFGTWPTAKHGQAPPEEQLETIQTLSETQTQLQQPVVPEPPPPQPQATQPEAAQEPQPGLPIPVKQEFAGVDQPFKVMTTTEKDRKRKQFYRMLEQPSKRSGKLEQETRCPAALALKIKQDSRGLGTWFQVFLENGENWFKVEMHFRSLEVVSKTTSKVKKEMTEAQLEEFHKSPTVVAAIKQTCKARGYWRPNPNAPLCESAIIYIVHLEEESETHSKTDETCMHGSGALENDAAQLLQGVIPGSGPVPLRTPPPPSRPPTSRASGGEARCVSPLATGALPAVGGVAVPPPSAATPPRPPPDAYGVADAAATAGPHFDLSDPVQAKAATAMAKIAAKQQASSAKAMQRKKDQQEKMQAKIDARHEAKEAAEAKKLLASSKAAVWSACLSKDIGVATALVDTIPSCAQVSEPLRIEYKSKMETWVTELKDLQHKMKKADIPEDTVAHLLLSGPALVKNFHECLKNWKYVEKKGL